MRNASDSLVPCEHSGEVGVSASQHIQGQDFSPVIKRALDLPGFSQADTAATKTTHMVGFGHASTLAAAGPILNAIKSGDLKHIFLVGGCDGNEPQRKYYKRLHAETPSDAVVLTLGCGKFRVLGQDWGQLGNTGLPRLLDMGQCNDAYSALMVRHPPSPPFRPGCSAYACRCAVHCGSASLPVADSRSVLI